MPAERRTQRRSRRFESCARSVPAGFAPPIGRRASSAVQPIATSRASLATVDPAEKRRLFERLSSIREIVFGVQDGVLTTAGVLCGLSGAVSQHSQVALAALASTAAGALSMAAGAYLGARAETEVLRAELDLVRADAAEKPYTVQEGLLDELSRKASAARPPIANRPPAQHRAQGSRIDRRGKDVRAQRPDTR